MADEFDLPMTDYWVSCSHNSYAEADQLAGTSSDAMYRRLLLQACSDMQRQVTVYNDGM